MYPIAFGSFSFWWIIPIAMMVLCFLMMRGRRGSMICGFGPCGIGGRQTNLPESAMDILDRRFAAGEIDKAEYEDMRNALYKPADISTD